MNTLSRTPLAPSVPLSRSLGFTVVELLTAVAILAVLAALAFPTFSDAIERSRLKSAAEAIASDLDLARLETAKRNTDLVVSFYNGGSWCYGIHAGRCDCTTAGSCSIKRVNGSDIVKDVTMGSVAFGANRFTAFDRIRGTAAAGQVNLLASAGLDLRVVVSTRGRVRICSPSNNVPGYPSC